MEAGRGVQGGRKRSTRKRRRQEEVYQEERETDGKNVGKDIEGIKDIKGCQSIYR